MGGRHSRGLAPGGQPAARGPGGSEPPGPMVAAALRQLQLLPCCGGARRRTGQLAEGEDQLEFMLEVEGSEGEKVFDSLYVVGEKLGEGTFGKVYACSPLPGAPQGPRRGEPTCVKMVPRTGRHGNRGSKILQDEKTELLRLYELLEHPNIVRYHRFVLTSDMLYIVMSRCEGPGLMDYVEATGTLLPMDAPSGPSARGLARQMLSALAAVHAIGMMHRDVKPDNFRFQDREGDCLQLLDFGAAKPDAKDSPAAHSVTGTLLFAAPEVFDAFYCRSCDLWSVGVVYFLLVSGHAPFETSDVTMLRSMHRDPVLTGDSLLRGEQWKSAPHGARELARGLLEVDPSRRLSAAAALQLPWLRQDGSQDEADLELDSARSHPLVHSNSRSASITDLRRSYFVWNLADCNSSDNEDDSPGAVPPFGSQQLLCAQPPPDAVDDGVWKKEEVWQGSLPSGLPSTADSADGNC